MSDLVHVRPLPSTAPRRVTDAGPDDGTRTAADVANAGDVAVRTERWTGFFRLDNMLAGGYTCPCASQLSW